MILFLGHPASLIYRSSFATKTSTSNYARNWKMATHCWIISPFPQW
jgi:hypothetical protein